MFIEVDGFTIQTLINTYVYNELPLNTVKILNSGVCNKHKTNDDKLDLEGKVRKLLLEIAREPAIKSIKEEFNIAKKEYKESLFECKKAMMLLFKEQVTKLKILEKRSYFIECIRTLKNKVKEKAIEKTNKHFGAMVFSEEFYRRSNRFET